jgi:hypothetical protein
MSDQRKESHILKVYGTREIDWDTSISIYFTQEAEEALVERVADRGPDRVVVEVMGMVPL